MVCLACHGRWHSKWLRCCRLNSTRTCESDFHAEEGTLLSPLNGPTRLQMKMSVSIPPSHAVDDVRSAASLQRRWWSGHLLLQVQAKPLERAAAEKTSK